MVCLVHTGIKYIFNYLQGVYLFFSLTTAVIAGGGVGAGESVMAYETFIRWKFRGNWPPVV